MAATLRRVTPALRLRQTMRATADLPAALAAFESRFWSLPIYPEAELLDAAADRYATVQRPLAARLVRSMARMRRRQAPPETPSRVAPILSAADPGKALQLRLEVLDRQEDPQAAASLIRAVFAHAAAPITRARTLHRARRVFVATGDDDEAFLFACMALQLEPTADECLLPVRTVLQRLRALGQWDAAADLLSQWQRAQPERPALEEADEADILARGSPHATRLEWRELVSAEEQPAQEIGLFGAGMPFFLQGVLQSEMRPAVAMMTLDDAEVLIAEDSVAVFASDGEVLPACCVGAVPSGLVADALERRRQAGEPVDAREVAAAVLIADPVPAPNYCRFLLDHATRLALYAQAGIDLTDAIVIGPNLTQGFQREIARRMGAVHVIGTGGFGVVRARRLAVLSNCRHPRHPAHLGAAWAIRAVRQAFGVPAEAPCGSRRVFVSRTDAGTRQLQNEKMTAAILVAEGFERVVPGEMTIPEQAALFAQASHVVGVHGAGLANLVFCGTGTEVLEIFHPFYGTAEYAALAPALDLRYAAMVGSDGSSDAPGDNAPVLAPHGDDCIDRDLRADLPELLRWLRERG